jgi:hypothetical protein
MCNFVKWLLLEGKVGLILEGNTLKRFKFNCAKRLLGDHFD